MATEAAGSQSGVDPLYCLSSSGVYLLPLWPLPFIEFMCTTDVSTSSFHLDPGSEKWTVIQTRERHRFHAKIMPRAPRAPRSCQGRGNTNPCDLCKKGQKNGEVKGIHCVSCTEKRRQCTAEWESRTKVYSGLVPWIHDCKWICVALLELEGSLDAK